MAIKSWSREVTGTRTCSGVTVSVPQIAESHTLTVSTSANPGGNNPFDSTHYSTSGSVFQSEPGASSPIFSNYLSSLYSYEPGFISAGSVSNADFTAVYARTNPSNPNIMLPVFWLELRDLPDMIRQGGRIAHALKHGKNWKKLIRNRSAPRDLAAAHLAIQFGWAPFISDLRKIATFQDAVDKRRKMFDKLAKKGLRGRVELGTGQSTFVNERPMFSGCQAVYYAKHFVVCTYERWGTVRWKPNNNSPLPRTDGELRRRMTGLTMDQVLPEVWEALPWSWLTDYFVDIGAKLKAGNRVLASPSHCCVMTKYVNTVTHDARRINQFTVLTGGTKRLWRHQRTPHTTTPLVTAALPQLSGGQLSILGALATLRAPRGR